MFLKLAVWLMWGIIFVGCLYLTFALVALYLLFFGYAIPGQPIFLDDLAPSYGEVATMFVVGLACLGFGFGVRAMLARKA